MSLGRAWIHQLPGKLRTASEAGFDGIELFFEDLEYFSRESFGSSSQDALLAGAEAVKRICAEVELEIICLQPFSQYEGLRDRTEHVSMLKKACEWFEIANRLGTDLVSVPSNFLDSSKITNDEEIIVSDLQELAELACSYKIRLVYEALCWGTHVNTWEHSWKIVQAVDRPNFGICFDTFNIAGLLYADPEAADGKTLDAEEAVRKSVERITSVDREKVFYIQVVDAERLIRPLLPGHPFFDEAQDVRMSWSRNCRLFYGETDLGAYLPIRYILQGIIKELGFDGWLSMELFNRSMVDPRASVPREHAQRGIKAWARVCDDLSIERGSSATKQTSNNFYEARAPTDRFHASL